MKRHDSWTERIWKIFNVTFARDRDALRVVNDNESQFGESLVVNRTPVIELNSSYGVSALRDQTTVTGSATVTNSTTGEILVSTGATAGSTACLQSAEVGRYMPGFGAELGIGVRFGALPTDHEVRIGGVGSDKENGVFFGVDGGGIFISRRRASVNRDKVYQQGWNIDTLDGNGISGVNLDLLDGSIFQIDFTWYGYGQILFGIVEIVNNKQAFVPCHSLRVERETSLNSPNLRVCVEADNNTATTDLPVYVGGRQYSIVGNYQPKYRFTGDYRGDTATSTTVIPLISFHRKAAFGDRSIKVQGYDAVVVTEPLIIEVRIDPILTGATFTNPTDYVADETSLVSDTSATAVSGGYVLWQQLIAAGQNKNSASLASAEVDLDVPNGQTVSLCARTVTGTGSVTSCFRMREEW